MKIKNLKIGFLLLSITLVSVSVFALFYTGIISPSENASDIANVNHPAHGNFPKILTDVAYDVDASQSLSLNYTRYLIENAQSLADANNGWIDWYEKFHFWPNIFDLTEIYYYDNELYNKIVDEILENNTDRNNISINISGEISRGDRIFLARDFVSVVQSKGRTYYEVHYAFLINLDEKYIQEISVHNFGEKELRIHDAHTNELTSLFNKSDTPLGQLWEICLRGNLKRTKYNSIIVDKLDESPNPEFFIERIHLSCGSCCNKEELPIAPPLVPLKKPPPKPKPEEKIPIPSKNPNNPQPPLIHPGPGGSVTTPGPSVRPWPFGYPEKPEDESPPFTPGGGETDRSNEGCPEDEEVIYQKQQMLIELNKTLEESIAKFNEDIKTLNDNFTCYPGQWENNATFNDPCIQEVYESYNEKVQELKRQIDGLLRESRNNSNEIKSLKDKFSLIVQTYIYRESLWENMLYIGGEWSHVSVPCGGGVLMIGHSSGSPAKINVTPEQQEKFQQQVGYAMMQGKTWEEAVKEAYYVPKNSNWGDYVWKEVWAKYAECLKELHTKQLEIYLKKEFPEASEEQIAKMINVMFNGLSALTQDQKDELEDINEQIDEFKNKQEKLANQIFNRQTQINDLRREFRQKIRENCIAHSREEIEKNRQTVWVLESFLEYCKNPDREYEFKYINRTIFCNTLSEMLNNTAYTSNRALEEYLKTLIENHCGE